MIVDSHVHIYGFPSFKDLGKYIQTMEDAISFRTRHPEVYKCNLTELPIDNSDDLVSDMDRNGVDFALVQARAGHVSNDLVASAVRRHPKRMVRASATIRKRADTTTIPARRARPRRSSSTVR